MEEIEIPDVAVMVSRKLMAQLDEWSEPVQVRITRAPRSITGWEMEMRRPFPNTAAGLEAHLVPVTGETSDGYHTFNDLYAHRRALTAVLAAAAASDEDAWRSKAHHPEDSPIFPGYFIVGIELPTGTITYHYALEFWDEFGAVAALEHAPKWDGASPEDTVSRCLELARLSAEEMAEVAE